MLSLVAQIVRAGVAVSRSTARRALKKAPKNDGTSAPTAASTACEAADAEGPTTPGYHILKPTCINRTWHTDLTTFRVFWLELHVLAILDGFSRKLLALNVSLKTPTTADVLATFKNAVAEFGAPRFVVSDHGPQFGAQWTAGVSPAPVDRPSNGEGGAQDGRGPTPVRSKVRNPCFNGRCERFFKSFKLCQRVTLFFAAIFDIKRKVEFFRGWYNAARVHQGVDGRTPNEVWNGTPRRETTRYLATDKMQPVFDVARAYHGDDPHLPVFNLKLAQFVKRIA